MSLSAKAKQSDSRSKCLGYGCWKFINNKAGSHLKASIKGSPAVRMVSDEDISLQSFVRLSMLGRLRFNDAL